MLFLVGTIDKRTGYRHIYAGQSDIAVKVTKDLTDGGKPKEFYDWGPLSNQEAATRLAHLVLTSFAPLISVTITVALVQEFTEVIQTKMEHETIWFLLEIGMMKWLQERTVVQ